MADQRVPDDLMHLISKLCGDETRLNMALTNRPQYDNLYAQLVRDNVSNSRAALVLKPGEDGWMSMEKSVLAHCVRTGNVNLLSECFTHPRFTLEDLGGLGGLEALIEYAEQHRDGSGCLGFLLDLPEARANPELGTSAELFCDLIRNNWVDHAAAFFQRGRIVTDVIMWTEPSDGSGIVPVLFAARSAAMVRVLSRDEGVRSPSMLYNGRNALHFHCNQLWTPPSVLRALLDAGFQLEDVSAGKRWQVDMRLERDPTHTLAPPYLSCQRHIKTSVQTWHWTALATAAANLNAAAVRVLLRAGASVPRGGPLAAPDGWATAEHLEPGILFHVLHQRTQQATPKWLGRPWRHHIGSGGEGCARHHHHHGGAGCCCCCTEADTEAVHAPDFRCEFPNEDPAGVLASKLLSDDARVARWMSQVRRLAGRMLAVARLLVKAGPVDMSGRFDPKSTPPLKVFLHTMYRLIVNNRAEWKILARIQGRPYVSSVAFEMDAPSPLRCLLSMLAHADIFPADFGELFDLLFYLLPGSPIIMPQTTGTERLFIHLQLAEEEGEFREPLGSWEQDRFYLSPPSGLYET